MNILDYSDAVLEHFRSAARSGQLPHRPGAVFQGEAGSPKAGTWISIQAEIDPRGRIGAVRYRAFGCPYAIAACSWVSAQLEGADVARCRAPWVADVQRALALPAEKLGVVVVLEDALRALAAAWAHCHEAEARRA